jgi:hypothetical protein
VLKPDTANPGLWVNDAWTPGSPGTFAVIVGVSRYQHLDGSQKHFGLGQLFVSALTAFRFFTWLEKQYMRNGSPLCKCWLLLSPTPDEEKTAAGITTHALEPTFGNCDQAIQDWNVEMSQLPAAAASLSRSVFFFSGHGLEVLQDRQILLPSDYLRPGSPIDRALSTQNIARGLKALSIPLHFLFLDACRNDHNMLGQQAPLEGTKILNEPTSAAVNADCFVPIFYGSAAGTQALQPNDPNLGVSLFGEALLDGLSARGLRPDCDSGTCCIFLHRLRPFVETKICEIVRTRYNQTSSQKARVSGDQTEEPVTEVPPPTGSAPPAVPGQPPPQAAPLGLPPIIHPTIASFGEVHALFGSEQITDLWMNKARVFDFEAQYWLPKGSDIQISGLRRWEDNTAFVFDLFVPGAQFGHVYWLQIEDSVQSQAFVLPTDRSAIPRFRVEMEFQFNPGVIKRFDVSLSPDNQTCLGRIGKLWDIYNEISAHEALRRLDQILDVHLDHLEELLLRKNESPLSATVAGVILLRARRWDKLHDWLRNLANRFPEIPDGLVLWAEQCLRQPGSNHRKEAIEYFLRLDSKPLPGLVEPLGYALRQAEDFSRDPEYDNYHDAITRIHGRLAKAVTMFRPGGLLATFAGPTAELSPEILAPTKIKGKASAKATS